MIEAPKKDRPIGKRLQLLLIIPLILAVIICSVIVIAAVFITQQDWVSNTEKTIQDQELWFMQNYINSVKYTQEVSMLTYSVALNLFSEIYKKKETNEIEASQNLQQAIFKNAYSTLSDNYPDNSSSVWVSGNSESTGPDSEQIQVPDAFLRSYYYSTNSFLQAGYLTNDGDDMFYLYPIQNMSFLSETFNYSETCQEENSDYRPECTDSYQYLFGKDMYLLIYYENQNLNIYLNFLDDTPKASVLILPQESFTGRLLKDTRYTTFVCEKKGSWTVVKSDSVVQDFIDDNREISAALYKNNNNARRDFRDNVLQNFNSSDQDAFIVVIDSQETFFAYDTLNFTVNGISEINYTVCTYRSRSDVFNTWNNFNDEVLIVMIIQACIYAGFLIVTFIIAWRLALVIDHRVAVPIESISGYMKCGNPTLYMIQDSYNCQLNSILNNLRQIEIIEKMIDPLFLQDPITENRIKNLEIISELFKNIDNKRGWALVLNLLGNIKFLDKKMKEAEEHYRKALEVLELLMNELEVQEESESKLEDKEKQKLGILEDDCFWDEKKKLVLENIKDQQLQIIFAMSTRIKENGSGSFPLNRKKWKEIIKLYTKVLQFYMDSKENCADFLDLLIDLAEVFQILNYYHTAKGLLDIVQVDLSQLRSNHKSKIDIDSGRLQKFGLDIKESKKKEHFSVNPEQFELDILTQKLFYIKGKLNLDKENYHKAGKDFQQAILVGTYFDPEIRKQSIKELYGLVHRYKLEVLANDLQTIYNYYSEPKTNFVITLAFDLIFEEKLSIFIIQFVQTIIDENSRLGAISKNNVDKVLDVIERDFPPLDMENFIIQSRNLNHQEHLFDSLGRAADLLNSLENYNEEKNFLIVFFKKSREIPSLLTMQGIEPKIGKNTKIIFVSFGEIFSLDLEIFIEDLDGERILVEERSFHSCEEEIKKYVSSSLVT